MRRKRVLGCHLLAIILISALLGACGGGTEEGPSGAEPSPAATTRTDRGAEPGASSTFDPDNLPLDAAFDATHSGPPFRSDREAVETFEKAYRRVELDELQTVWSRMNAVQRLEALQRGKEISDGAPMADYQRMLPAEYLLDAENLSELERAAEREARANDPTRGIVRGRVLDGETRQPIADLYLNVGPTGIRTDDEGAFEVLGLAPGPTQIFAFLNSYERLETEVEVTAGRAVETTLLLEPSRSRIPDSERGTVRGVIVDKQTREPIAGAELVASTPAAALDILTGNAPELATRTDDDGSFEIAGVPAGEVNLVGQKLPLYPIFQHPVTVVALETVETRIELQRIGGRLEIPLVVAGVVRDALTGEPVGGVQVSAGAYKGATSGPDGRYLIREAKPGQLTLVARHPDYHESSEPLIAEKPGRVDRDISIRPITTGSITGIAVDRTTGEPLAGAVVTIGGEQIVTDPDGRFRVDELEAGEIAVQAGSDGYRPVRSELLLEPRTTAEARLELDPITEGTVAGVVTDAATGQPLPEARIRIGELATTSGADGRFELLDVPAGEAGVTAEKPVYEAAREVVEVIAAGAIEVRLALRPITHGTLVVVVRDAATGEPLADSTVRLAGSGAATTDAQGRARFDDVAQGRGTVSAERHAYVAGQQPFELQAATELEQVVRLEPVTVGVVAGRVVAAGSRKPIAGAAVRLADKSTTTDPQGQFRFDEIQAGETVLTASKPVFEPGRVTVRVIAAETASLEIELVPVTYGSIRGRVVDSVTGKPVAAARVTVQGLATETDPEGRFELERVPAGRLLLAASQRLYEPGNATLELAPAQALEPRLALEPITYGRLTGQVVDAETGAPLAGAEVSFGGRSATSGSDGRFEAERVPAGRLTVSARQSAYRSGGVDVRLEPADSAEALIELEPIKVGSVVGVVRDARTGEPIAGARVNCGDRSVEADERGRFRCDQVTAGSVGVRARHADYGDGAVTGTLGGGGTLDLEVRLDLRREDVTQLESALAAAGSIDLYGIHFDSGSDQFKPSSLGTLNAVLQVIKRAPDRTFRIAGHTDSDGTDEFNQDLSERRARTVIDWLIEQGIAAARLERVGYGESRPAAPNDTASGKALNRRVELSYDD